MGKKCRKAGLVAPLCLLWTICKERNKITFVNEDFFIQRMKNLFVCNLWSWSKSCLDVGPLPLINFFDWLGSS